MRNVRAQACVRRPRPPYNLPDMLIISVDRYSFPSGVALRCKRVCCACFAHTKRSASGHTSRCTVLAGLFLSCTALLGLVRPAATSGARRTCADCARRCRAHNTARCFARGPPAPAPRASSWAATTSATCWRACCWAARSWRRCARSRRKCAQHDNTTPCERRLVTAEPAPPPSAATPPPRPSRSPAARKRTSGPPAAARGCRAPPARPPPCT